MKAIIILKQYIIIIIDILDFKIKVFQLIFNEYFYFINYIIAYLINLNIIKPLNL